MAKPAVSAPPPKPIITYGFHRDPRTGCWVFSRYELPPDVAEEHLVHIDEPRHMPSALAIIGQDIARRGAAGE